MLRPSPRYAWQTVAGQAVLLDLTTGRAIGLNGTASFIWSRLERETPREIATALAAAFRVEPEVAGRDVDEFVESLRATGMLEEAAS